MLPNTQQLSVPQKAEFFLRFDPGANRAMNRHHTAVYRRSTPKREQRPEKPDFRGRRYAADFHPTVVVASSDRQCQPAAKNALIGEKHSGHLCAQSALFAPIFGPGEIHIPFAPSAEENRRDANDRIDRRAEPAREQPERMANGSEPIRDQRAFRNQAQRPDCAETAAVGRTNVETLAAPQNDSLDCEFRLLGNSKLPSEVVCGSDWKNSHCRRSACNGIHDDIYRSVTAAGNRQLASAASLLSGYRMQGFAIWRRVHREIEMPRENRGRFLRTVSTPGRCRVQEQRRFSSVGGHELDDGRLKQRPQGLLLMDVPRSAHALKRRAQYL